MNHEKPLSKSQRILGAMTNLWYTHDTEYHFDVNLKVCRFCFDLFGREYHKLFVYF
jgi:hypothetical protein